MPAPKIGGRDFPNGVILGPFPADDPAQFVVFLDQRLPVIARFDPGKIPLAVLGPTVREQIARVEGSNPSPVLIPSLNLAIGAIAFILGEIIFLGRGVENLRRLLGAGRVERKQGACRGAASRQYYHQSQLGLCTFRQRDLHSRTPC